jgi:hypothetical protein
MFGVHAKVVYMLSYDYDLVLNKSNSGGGDCPPSETNYLMELVMPFHNDNDRPPRGLPIMSGVGFPVRLCSRLTQPI